MHAGAFCLPGVAGLHDVEYPGRRHRGPGSLPAARRFQIDVADAQARFLPVSFLVDAPFKRHFPDRPGPVPGSAPPGFYLFSAPTRAGTRFVAVVRAQLNERLDAVGRPAAYAVSSSTRPAATPRRLADARGVAALLFPYPALPAQPLGVTAGKPAAGDGLAAELAGDGPRCSTSRRH